MPKRKVSKAAPVTKDDMLLWAKSADMALRAVLLIRGHDVLPQYSRVYSAIVRLIKQGRVSNAD